jgi:hypothetical protein
MSFTVDELLKAVLDESKTTEPKGVSLDEKSQYGKLAEALETSAKMNAESSDPERFHKLAMAVILDTVNDPKAKPYLEKLSYSIVKEGQIGGGVANEGREPGTIGEITEGTGVRTIEKLKVDKNRTLFKRLKDSHEQDTNVPGPANQTN